MTETFNVQEAKAHFSRLLERVHAGEEIILAKSGEPHARLMPLPRSERTLGFLKGKLDDRFFDPLPEPELNAWQSR